MLTVEDYAKFECGYRYKLCNPKNATEALYCTLPQNTNRVLRQFLRQFPGVNPTLVWMGKLKERRIIGGHPFDAGTLVGLTARRATKMYQVTAWTPDGQPLESVLPMDDVAT